MLSAQKTFLLIAWSLAFARASQDSVRHLRAQSLHVATPRVLALLQNQNKSHNDQCKCTFEDECSCDGALKFMRCVKNACESGLCECLEPDGADHFVESCSAMGNECSDVGLQCSKGSAQCKDKDVTWKPSADDESAEEVMNPKKYVTVEKYEAKQGELESQSHRIFAETILMSVMVLSLTVAMASSSNGIVSKHTWSTLDYVVSTFIAKAWFHVVANGLNFFALQGLAKVFVHLAVTLVFLSVAIYGSWALRKNDEHVASFNGICGPMVLWCNTGFASTAQQYVQDSALHVFLFIIVLVGWYAILSLVAYRLVPEQGWADGTENSMAGGAIAASFVLWLHMVISGSYQSIEMPHKLPPSRGEATVMLVMGLIFFALALVGTPAISNIKKKRDGYWWGRIFDVLLAFVGVLPYFSVALSLAHMLVENSGYPPGAVQAQLLNTLISTVVGIVMILTCAYAPVLRRDTVTAKQMSGVLLGLGGFIMGFAWYSLLDNSIDMMVRGGIGAGYSRADPFVTRLECVVFLSVVIFPVYAAYIKPVSMSKSK